MEVMQHFNGEAVEEAMEESLVRRRDGRLSKSSSTSSTSSSEDEESITQTNGDNGDLKPLVGMKEEEPENKDGPKESVYFDQNQDDEKYIKAAEDLIPTLMNVDIQNVISAVVNGQNGENLKEKLLPSDHHTTQQTRTSQEEDSTTRSRGGFNKGKAKHISFGIHDDDDEETDEEVIELEFFERTAHKLHTHDVQCPNCNSQITKVVLRRRKVKNQVSTPATPRGDLFGCLSCFSIFIPKGNKLRPFPLWTEGEVESTEAPSGNVQNTQGGGFNCFGYFGESSKPPQVTTGNGGFTSAVPPEGENNATQPVQTNETAEDAPLQKPGNKLQPHPLPQYPGHGEIIVNIPEKQGNDVLVAPVGERPVAPQSPELTNAEKPDIIKSIVYGGLTESITSLSVITSAAASNATTLNIVALGFANLIGGLFVMGQNLRDLKNDDQQVDRYKDLLGQKKHFLLHATLAILSYLVFGLVPPVVYGFTFRETDDRDYKLLAVAAASLICIVFLAIAKAYIQAGQHHKFTSYLKMVLLYVSTATMASGVGFAVGDLVNKFMEKLGWFEPNQAGTQLFLGNQSLHPSFASY